MNKLIQINPEVFGEEAIYKEQVIEEYRDNPYIEALPNIFGKEEVISRLTNYPKFDEAERELDGQYRCHITERLFQYFQPLSLHLELESRFSCTIRQGYISRNPLRAQFTKGLNEGYEMIRNKSLESLDNKTFSTTAYGLTIIGSSGMGKSASVNKVLALYPQVIIHSKYKGILFSQYQVVWIKVDCPHDGSIKGLCLIFLQKIDNILGSSYYKNSRNLSTNAIIPQICQLTRMCGMGIFVIDEIQNISQLKSGGAEKMLNFFMTLMNTIGIPVVLIGTNKAMSVLQSQFRQARRGIGTLFFDRVKSKNDVSWKLLIEGLFDYQWLKKPCLLTQEISDTLYEESQGIFDIAIKLFVMSQVRAINTKKEELSSQLIRYIAKENLKIVRPALDALKSGNTNKISQYEDIAPIDISEFMNQQVNQINMDNKIREIQQFKKKNLTINNDIREEAILKLLDLDVEPSKAKKNVELVLTTNNYLEVKEIVKKAYRMIIESDMKEPNKIIRKKDIKDEYTENDLRLIVQNGKKNKLSAYEALLNKGYIKPYLWNQISKE